MLSLLLVMAGGAAGAVCRYLLDRAVAARWGRQFPWGTLAVNVFGCFLLGLVSARLAGDLALLLGTGFCGALSTYSTFASESTGLLQEGRPTAALTNAGLSLVLGLGTFSLAVALAG